MGRLIENHRDAPEKAGAAHEHAALLHRPQTAIDTQTGMRYEEAPEAGWWELERE
jgi:hypothetical protein